jgi:integrase
MSVRKRTWTTRKGEQREAFIVHYLDQEGDPHIETFQLKKDADARAAEIKIDVKKGKHTAPSKSITIVEAAEKWIKGVTADGRERSTVDQYRGHVSFHIAPRLGKAKLANLTDEKIEAFRDDLLANLSRPLARKVMVSLRQLLKANRYGHVAAGVSIKLEQRHKRKLEAGRDVPRPDEIKRMVGAATDTRVRALLLLTAFTGLRSSELRGLRWSDVDLKDGVVHVRQRADKYYEIGAPKSAGSRREIPLDSGAVVPALKEWRMACPKGEADLVFPAVDGGPVHHEILLRSVGALQREAGVMDKAGEPKYGLHALRHFFASWCINPRPHGRELPPKSVQALMGHSSITMTLDTYGHLFPRNDDPAELAQSVRTLLG